MQIILKGGDILIKHINIFSGRASGNCPEGYDTVAQDLYGPGKERAEPDPDPNRSLQQCADICNDRSGCTGFEYANGPDMHGKCLTYTGGVGGGENLNRDQADSNWFSCVLSDKPSGNCPEGYDSIAQDLNGPGKKRAEPDPDPNRSLQQCAAICNDRSGCTGFEYSNGPDMHGKCLTYTGGDSDIKDNLDRDRADSNWFSCIKVPTM